MDRNGRLLLAAKAVRAFAFGLNSVTLGLYVTAVGLGPAEVGLVLSASLLGTTLLTLVVTVAGDRIGRRRLLAMGASLMALAALIPLMGGHPLAIALISLSGMVAVTGNESTGLQSVDQAALPQTVSPEGRTGAFAAYNVVSAVSGAAGALSVGPAVMVGEWLGQSVADRYAPAFVLYALAGLVALLLTSRMDAGVESGAAPRPGFAVRRSRGVVARLSVLFGVDSFASGLAVQSFLASWFALRFELPATVIGALFAVGSILSAASFPLAAILSARFGLVRTMVFTHIPASVLLILMAFAPSGLLAALLYLGRAALASMDVPARQSYTMAVVDPDERTATAGVTSLAKSGAQSVAPLVAGALLVPAGLGVPLVACGVLKIGYDVALFKLFRARPAPEESESAGVPAASGGRARRRRGETASDTAPAGSTADTLPEPTADPAAKRTPD